MKSIRERTIEFVEFLENQYNIKDGWYKNNTGESYEHFRNRLICDIMSFTETEQCENERLNNLFKKVKSVLKLVVSFNKCDDKYKHIHRRALEIAEERLGEIDK